jgi:hypothetical protein
MQGNLNTLVEHKNALAVAVNVIKSALSDERQAAIGGDEEAKNAEGSSIPMTEMRAPAEGGEYFTPQINEV